MFSSNKNQDIKAILVYTVKLIYFRKVGVQ